METVRVGNRGTVVIPQSIRKRLGISDGSLLLVDEVDGQMRLRPAVAVAAEQYTKERRAQFLLNDAIDEPTYREARKAVEAMGLDPDSIEHERPGD